MDMVERIFAKGNLINVDEKNQCFEFKCKPWENREGYWIAFDRCDSPEAILRWVNHIIPKNWVTKDVIEVFISCAMHRINYPLHPV